VQQVALYTVSDKSQVAISTTFTATPASLNRKLFTSPYRVTAGVDYVVAVLTNRYAYTLGGWPHTTTNMEAFNAVNGRFFETTAGVMAYPDNRNPSAANYHVSPVYDRESTFVSGTKWQLWKREIPIGSSTLLQNIEIGGGIIAGVGFAWKQVPGVVQSSIIQGDSYFTTIYHPSSDPGSYIFESGFGNPSNGSLSGNCIFHNGGAATVAPDDETFTDGAFTVDVEIDNSSALSHEIGQVVETSTVWTPAPRKIYTLNFATETGVVQPVSVVRAKTIGQVVELASVFDVDSIKSTEIGQVTESGVPFPVTGMKSKAIGQVTENGSVFSASSSQIVSAEIGQVLEFGSPGRLGPTPRIDTRVVKEIGTTEIQV